MIKRCCQNCVYATQAEGHWHRVMMGRFPGLRLCFNGVETPGRMQEIRIDGVCENFRARHWPKGKRCRPPKPPNDAIRYIPLTHGLYAIVDAEDYEWLSQHKCHARKDGKSRFIGVVPHKDKWLARVSSKGRRHHVGTFADEVEAARARDRKAVELFGRFARLNFPEECGAA